MRTSFIAVVLALAASAFAQTEWDDPVKMDADGNVIPATHVARFQYLEYMKRQIDEATAVKTDDQGDVVPFGKRAPEPVAPVVYIAEPGTELHMPVKMDALGNIVKA